MLPNLKIQEYKYSGIIDEELLENHKFKKSKCDKFVYYKFITLYSSILLIIKLNVKTKEHKVNILDDDFGQPYTPFYEYMEGNCKLFPALEKVIMAYHQEMDNLTPIFNK